MFYIEKPPGGFQNFKCIAYKCNFEDDSKQYYEKLKLNQNMFYK